MIEALIEKLLAELGEDTTREGLERTPERVAKALRYLTSGYTQKVEEILNDALFVEEYDEMVVVKDIDFFSMCEHHLLPFFGKAHVAYMPAQKIVGLSKIPRLVEMFSRRLQVQERLTTQIATTLDEVLRPRGVAVVMEGVHLCMLMRGVEKQNSKAVTSAMLGVFRERPETRAEFMELIKSSSGVHHMTSETLDGTDRHRHRGRPGHRPRGGRRPSPRPARRWCWPPAPGASWPTSRPGCARGGGRALAVPTDVTSAEAVDALVEQTVAELGRVDLLVTAAGVASFGPLAGTKPADWDPMLAVNLRGAMLCCRAVLPPMIRQRRGTIINVASIAARRPIAGAAVYSATKAGIVAFSRVLAEELRAEGVRVGVVVPGAVDTPLWDSIPGRARTAPGCSSPRTWPRAVVLMATLPPHASLEDLTLLPAGGIL